MEAVASGSGPGRPHPQISSLSTAPIDPNSLWRRHSAYPLSATEIAYRKMVRQTAAAICTTAGFDQIQSGTLETISYLVNAYIITMCEGTKRACEAAGRTKAIPADVWISLIDLGHDVCALPPYLEQIQQTGNIVIPPPKQQPPPVPPTPLQVGRTRPHPTYVNDFFPSFPDPHTYIKTEITGDPESSYEKVRELAAESVRENRMNLVDLMLRAYPNTCLYREYMVKASRQAQQILDDRAKSSEAMKAAHQQALRKAKLEKELGNVGSAMPGDLGEDILEDTDETSQDSALDMSDEEEVNQFEIEDNVMSMVRTRLLPHCFIVNPIPEFRPYLACLVSEDGAEEENNGEGETVDRQKDMDEAIDNSFLRPVRIPPKTELMEI